MRKTTLLWASVCLLLSGAFRPLDAAPEWEIEEDADGTGPVPPAVGLVHQFCAYRADPGPRKALFPRFFFNVFSGQCESFMYGGCRGNQNRFQSQEACRERCIAGRPDFCLLEAEVGPCRANIILYFYNHRSGRCEEFGYGGCEGNPNNFETEAECQRSCGDPDDSAQRTASSTPGTAKRNAGDRGDTEAQTQINGRPNFCLLEAEVGPCLAFLKHYFYNHRSGRCEEFVYGGCQGNQNNFETEAECQRSCGDPDDSAQRTASSTPGPAKRNAGARGRPDFCLLEAKVGRCRAHFNRYFYNHSSGHCELFVYGGCQGNQNNFVTEAECQRSCGDPDDSAQPTASSTPGPAKRNAGVRDFNLPSWCLTGADRGQCTANVTRFYYDSDAATCRTFSYGGCGGNENNFVSERACLKACEKAFTKRTLEGRLMETKRRKNSVEIGYEIY